jgi:hypothetical protein
MWRRLSPELVVTVPSASFMMKAKSMIRTAWLSISFAMAGMISTRRWFPGTRLFRYSTGPMGAGPLFARYKSSSASLTVVVGVAGSTRKP